MTPLGDVLRDFLFYYENDRGTKAKSLFPDSSSISASSDLAPNDKIFQHSPIPISLMSLQMISGIIVLKICVYKCFADANVLLFASVVIVNPRTFEGEILGQVWAMRRTCRKRKSNIEGGLLIFGNSLYNGGELCVWWKIEITYIKITRLD